MMFVGGFKNDFVDVIKCFKSRALMITQSLPSIMYYVRVIFHRVEVWCQQVQKHIFAPAIL